MSHPSNQILTDVELIAATEALGITGNIVPLSWMAHIQFEKGKPDFLGIMLLAELVYWHRPEVLARDEKTGQILQWKKRFKGNKLHRSRGSLAKKFFVSERQITDALTRLEAGGFIEREVCHQTNRLYLTPVIAKLSEITLQLERTYVNNGEVIHSPTPSKEEEKESTDSDASDSAETQDPAQSDERPRATDYAPINKNKEIRKENIADSNNKAAVAIVPKSIWLAAESFIGETLTPKQQKAMEAMLSSMMLETETRRRLQEEVEAGLTDSRCFSKTGRDFHRKLKAFRTSLQNGTWTRPLCMDEKHHATKSQAKHQQQQDTHALMLSWSTLWNELGSVHQWLSHSSSEHQRQEFRLLQQKHLLKLQEIESQLSAQNHTINFDAIKQKNKERLYVQ